MKHVKVTQQIKVRIRAAGCLGEPPECDLIAEYISHLHENRRFTMTGPPQQKPGAHINPQKPGHSFVKEQIAMDSQLFLWCFMSSLDYTVRGGTVFVLVALAERNERKQIPVCTQTQSERYLVGNKKGERCSFNVGASFSAVRSNDGECRKWKHKQHQETGRERFGIHVLSQRGMERTADEWGDCQDEKARR